MDGVKFALQHDAVFENLLKKALLVTPSHFNIKQNIKHVFCPFSKLRYSKLDFKSSNLSYSIALSPWANQ